MKSSMKADLSELLSGTRNRQGAKASSTQLSTPFPLVSYVSPAYHVHSCVQSAKLFSRTKCALVVSEYTLKQLVLLHEFAGFSYSFPPRLREQPSPAKAGVRASFTGARDDGPPKNTKKAS